MNKYVLKSSQLCLHLVRQKKVPKKRKEIVDLKNNINLACEVFCIHFASSLRKHSWFIKLKYIGTIMVFRSVKIIYDLFHL